MELDYELAYGLWLHRNRQLYQRAHAVKLGIEAAQNDADMPLAWFDGVAATEAQALAMADEENADRTARRVLAKTMKRMG